MGINLSLPPTPRLDGSLLPYLNTLANRIRDAFAQVNSTLSGSTTARLALTGVSTGTPYYDTTLNRLYIWNGTAWIVPYPLGELARATLTANSAAFIGIIYPLQVTGVVIEAGRKTRVRVHANIFSPTVNSTHSLSVCDGAGTIANQAYGAVSLANASEVRTCEHIWSGLAAGTYSFRMGVFASASSQVAGAATSNAFITVDDVGPV